MSGETYISISPLIIGLLSGGAMVLDKLPEPGRLTNLDNSKAMACCACSRCTWGLFGHYFLSSIISLVFLLLCWKRLDID